MRAPPQSLSCVSALSLEPDGPRGNDADLSIKPTEMKTRIPLTRIVLCVVAAFCSLSSRLPAESVIDEKFEANLSPQQWKFKKGEMSSGEGVLTLKAGGPEEQYQVMYIATAAPSEKLNFIKNEVTIKLANLAINGSAPADKRICMLILGSDNYEDTSTGMLTLRIPAEGNLLLTIVEKGTDLPQVRHLLSPVSLPIKSLTLTLRSSGATLVLEDAAGTSEQDIPFPSLPALWEQASPYLRLQCMRAPSSGDVQETLEGLRVDSIPAPTK